MNPEVAAAELLASHQVDEPPIPVDLIAEEVEGLDIQEAPDLHGVPGAPQLPIGVSLSGLLIPSELRIWINSTESARSQGRRRFTIAHELGHWRLHFKQQGAAGAPVYCRSDEVGADSASLKTARAMERQANRFAAALLLPEELVRREASRWKLNVHVLAKRFDVSLPAMKLRLQLIDLLPTYMR